MLNINEKCIDILLSDIIPSEEFPVSTYNDDITGFIPYLVELDNI